MLDIIIFSFNRAMQLETLLSSIRRYWKKPVYNIVVIYNTSNNEFQRGYDILIHDYPGYVFIKEKFFNCLWHFQDYFSVYNLKKMLRYKNQRKQKTNFRDLLNAFLHKTGSTYTMFLTDDSVFIRDVELLDEDLSFINQDVDLCQISLRLGRNISRKPSAIKETEGKFKWKFHEHLNAKSWGYNFSVDAHIYATSLIRRVLKSVIFNNPTTLEANVVHYARKHGIMDCGMAFEQPYILSYPLNMVQNIANNESLGVSVEMLNQSFLDGKRLLYVIPYDIREFQQYPKQVVMYKNGNREYIKL